MNDHLYAPCFVYLLRCRDGSLYCGATTNLERRTAQHNSGKGARYTRSRLPVSLVWSEAQPNWPTALSREAEIKKMKKKQKEKLVAT